MIRVGEQGIFISDTAAKKLSPYNLSQFKKTLVLDLNALQSFTETDPVFTAWQTLYDNHTDWDTAYSWGNHASAGYLTSYTETDPVFSAWLLATPPLYSYTETDPIYTASSWYSTTNNSSNWNTAFGWGNHASVGYLTSITSGQVTAALGYTPYDATNPSGYITSSSLSSYVPNTRTLTINGTTYDLSSNRSWTISTGTTYTFSTGLTNTAGTITSNLSTGISGGQSVIGGTASGNNLTLSSTSNATKGKIFFGTSAYDEVNNRLLVGSSTLVSSLGYGTLQDNVIQLGDNISTNYYAHSPSMAFSTNQTGVGQLVGRLIGVNSSLGTSEKRVAQIGLFTDTATNNGKITLDVTNGTTFVSGITVNNSGNVGIQVNTPTAYLHIKAGTATANTAPLKLTSGTNLTTPENGAFEFDGTNLYFTVGGVRKIVTLT